MERPENPAATTAGGGEAALRDATDVGARFGGSAETINASINGIYGIHMKKRRKWGWNNNKRMETVDVCDPYSRPARRTQWIVSTLAYHYGLDRGVENEIIVLATGLDQYLQEIFHHLDCQGTGKIPSEDFTILCEILGLKGKGGDDGEDVDLGTDAGLDTDTDTDAEERAGILDALAREVSFRQFHAKLCGYFSTKAGCRYEDGRMLVGKESQHIETQIRLRNPLRRKEKMLRLAVGSRSGSGCGPGPCGRECYEEIVALEEAEDRISKLEDENASLRELVEDMRAALQSSDARSLALQVGLWKSHSKHKPDNGCFIARHARTSHKSGNSKNLQGTFLPEMDLLRARAVGTEEEDVEEALFLLKQQHHQQQQLEKELRESREAVLLLEECNRALKNEHLEMRRKMEEARQALLSGLAKVKELEAKAGQVSGLRRQVQRLETELLYYRSEASKVSLAYGGEGGGVGVGVGRRNQRCCLDARRSRGSPTGRDENVHDHLEEQLFRSVEGQAASDEEEERWTGEQQRQVEEVKRILTRLSCCGDRCDERALKRLLAQCGESRAEETHAAVLELLDRVTRLHKQLELRENQARNQPEPNPEQMKDSLLQELQQKAEETELLHRELQMLETERVRLSLVEDKLMDVLQLLQQLRDLNVSRRSLGKILLSTLESCSDPQHGKAHILEVLNALCHELAACEILSSSSTLERTPSHQSITNSLLVSC